ncbi:MAG TPA: Na(+)/H(+) antiporter subunit B [Spirochaetota bacterium]|nr:Na(+)/H(+) antiporter subunit B [Spirochaetota bacterium]
MRKIISILLLFILTAGFTLCLLDIPFGEQKTKVGNYYINNGARETGAANIVTSVVVNYRGFDTLGEITILFTAAIGLAAVLGHPKKNKDPQPKEPASLIVYTGYRILFPFMLLFGAYIFIHGHLTPGGGFQGGAVIASAFILMYMSSKDKKINPTAVKIIESLAGLTFVGTAAAALTLGRPFLSNFMPKGEFMTLLSAGIIPVIYIAVGFKVGAEFSGIIHDLTGGN